MFHLCLTALSPTGLETLLVGMFGLALVDDLLEKLGLVGELGFGDNQLAVVAGVYLIANILISLHLR
jgi:hypothetical protein